MSVVSQLEIKPSLLSYKLADTIAVEELGGDVTPTLKQNYISLIDQLEIDGIPKEKISALGKQIIIEKKKQKMLSKGFEPEDITVGRWWREVARQRGCTDTKYSSVDVAVAPPQNTSINTKNKKPNIRFIDYLRRTKEICDIAIKKFEESEDITKILSDKQLNIISHEWENILNIAEDAFNEKTKVPLNTQHLLLTEAATASSITNAATTFQVIKQLYYAKTGKFLTSKQIGFIQNGTVPKYLSLFKPDSRDTAIFQGYYGLACHKCKSWRVEKKAKLHCIDCDFTFQEKTVSKCAHCQIPFYKERLVHIIKTGRCEDCNVENQLPDELIQYADPDHSIRNELKIH